jgi:hypothetical protein
MPWADPVWAFHSQGGYPVAAQLLDLPRHRSRRTHEALASGAAGRISLRHQLGGDVSKGFEWMPTNKRIVGRMWATTNPSDQVAAAMCIRTSALDLIILIGITGFITTE